MHQSLIKALGIIDCSIFKRVSTAKFELLFGGNSWLYKLIPEALENPIFDYRNGSAFLDDFFIDAEEFWRAGEEGKIQSGVWSEQTSDQLLKLEAIAAVSNGECFLLVNNLENEYARLQKTLQAARELLLTNEKMKTQYVYVHDKLDALLSETQSTQALQHPISLAIQQAEIGVAILDPNLLPVSQNPALCELLELQYDIQDESPCTQLLQLFEKQYPEYEQVITTGDSWKGEIYWLAPPHRGKWFKLALYPVKEEQQIKHWIMLASDITQVKFLLQNNEQLCHFDALTELPNRQYFWQQLELSVHRGQPFFLLYLDIKHFKNINEIHGHLTGDQIIRDLAARIKPMLNEGDILARVGGAEFAILQRSNKLQINGHDQSQCIEYAEALINIAIQPFYTASGHKCEIGLNVGAASFPQDAYDAEELMKFADLAVYAAKKKPKSNIQFYSQESKNASRKKIELEKALREAITNDEFELYLQPILDLNSGSIIKAEALIRWNRPNFGVIGPDEFIPIAEQSGLIVPIGKWAFTTACQFLRELKQRDLDIRLSVNLSPRQINDGKLLSFIHSTVRRTQVAPLKLELELTEGVLIDNYDKVQHLLEQVRKLGIKVSIDDFGTGYSSLSYLQKLQVDHIKIDRTFVRELGNNENGNALVLAIIAMAQSLKLGLIAEGVETIVQRNFLTQNNCHIMQGFLFSQAVPFEDFCQLLNTQHDA